MKTAIITGITGQDGAYLASLLLGKGYRVFGTYRRSSTTSFWRIEELGLQKHPQLHLEPHDLTDLGSCLRLLEKTAPAEIYNLAAQSCVSSSFLQPIATAQTTALGPLTMLEAIRAVDPGIRFFQASTSEMFGKAQAVPQVETTPFYPRSPYGTAKLYAHWSAVNYRESYGLFAATGIMFNHESPLRGREFVTRKISDSFAKIRLGLLDVLELGCLDARRDWGFAPEYVEGMWRMLQADAADTYVLATNRAETVRTFASLAAGAAGFDLDWRGRGEAEIGVDRRSGKTLVRLNPEFYRPPEVNTLVGDPQKARDTLGWAPRTSLETICSMMVDADIRRNQQGLSF